MTSLFLAAGLSGPPATAHRRRGQKPRPYGTPALSAEARLVARRRRHDEARRVGEDGPPHLLEVVEGANLGPEQVDDDVAGVDQNPVGLLLAFDREPLQPGAGE